MAKKLTGSDVSIDAMFLSEMNEQMINALNMKQESSLINPKDILEGGFGGPTDSEEQVVEMIDFREEIDETNKESEEGKKEGEEEEVQNKKCQGKGINPKVIV